MVSEEEGISPRKRRKIGPPKAAPYVLRSLFDQVPLNSDDNDDDVHITTVEYWNDNLYIGTSAAEILHFVCLPPDPSDKSNEPSFILASRLPIPFAHNAAAATKSLGIQQILLLPAVNKACVLCNGTVTFYMLPELSPAFGNTKVNNCSWIGGVDLNTAADEQNEQVVMIAAPNRTMLVRIGEEARRIRNIEFPGCLVAARRGIIACAADAHSYSLVDVENQQKIQLFPISFSNEDFVPNQIHDVSTASPLKSPSSPFFAHSPTSESHLYERSSSSNTISGLLQPHGHKRSGSATSELSPESGTPRRSLSTERAGSASPRRSMENSPPDSESGADERKPLPPLPKPTPLKPHILSPTPSEFLLVRGTDGAEPGVGMFVNVDGDVVRGTITFHKYPESIIIDKGDENNMIHSPDNTHEQLLLAVIEAEEDGQRRKFLEVQLWDVDPGEADDHKMWVEIPSSPDMQHTHVGLNHTISPSQLEIAEMGKLLQMVRLKTPSLAPHVPATDPRTQASIEHLQKEKELFEGQEGAGEAERGWETERNAEEAKFARALGQTQSSLIMWNGNQIWRVVKNPLTTQLDDALQSAQVPEAEGRTILKREAISNVIELVQAAEPKSESEFLGLNYLKQKASLLLFGDLILMDSKHRDEATIDATERALIVGNLDPRIPLLLIPLLRREVLQSPQGIWIHAGLAQLTEGYVQQLSTTVGGGASDSAVLDMIKRFLFSWQQKRGYGSITDESYVFDSVDAAFLHLLLEQDAHLAPEQRAGSSLRIELNRLVDNWKGNLDRAVALLEQYRRLFVLSRLYQSQKMSRNVLKTWRRIIEGEEDLGGEITIAGTEAQMRRYLVKIKDVQLVEEYGAWLAQRNPSLGIQVFSDGTSRVKLETADVVDLLKQQAPNAVQAYLEHLVFARNLTQYADDLLAYYLDSVLSVLESSPSARASLSESYSTYRALSAPKPTYMNFITVNTPSEPWWQSRLRLLQLLGGGSTGGSQFTTMPPRSFAFSIPAVLARIEPFQNELVSESIILDGLQGRHREALHLLTHGLGDYDSAVQYCLFGGPRATSSSASFAERPLQSELFRFLLDEFLAVEDLSERIERTSDLLGRFAAWFDVGEVLRVIPDEWSVDILSGFLAHVFRVLVGEGREVRIARALSAGLNLRVGTEYIEGVEKVGPWVEDGDGLRRMKDRPVMRAGGRESEDSEEFGDIVEADARNE
ncbi:putative TGF beta receptor associated protein 1 [Aspergillus saccharolyticus JOP 1030-1]|uniref:Putative TGF beta receptor associated protein 1 n=1 Tax=Aspergillus saccharolyticus JOP 1030-1 TaxID=1450539 RepID=A0A319A4H5_9EURO|nr:putative TGF beta receptor associated protein 1 [Aspergillus saccharolyticus JOP 1030-1]PYH42342.1 putative TGF beta receptor associated protein 1 [Aspergillus saccharolyticus JOP 1030-1]